MKKFNFNNLEEYLNFLEDLKNKRDIGNLNFRLLYKRINGVENIKLELIN